MSTLKRGLDVVGACCGLAVFAPVMALTAAAIRLEGGPVLFRQTRLGRGRRPFTVLKFRSMRDGEVTPVGRLLRASGLDELPQFVNILTGDMSAVGPRPLTPATVTQVGWDDAAYDFRWQVSPGLTGLAQLVGSRSPAGALALDRAYLAHQSLWLDCRLIALSFAVNALGKARVQRSLSGARWVTRILATPAVGGARPPSPRPASAPQPPKQHSSLPTRP
jgi:lipopolysaccharide/colanic/teichoic acid biosynthesis glycosyltransferase